MEFSELKELLADFNESDIRELDLKSGEFALFLSKNDQAREAISFAQDETKLPQEAPKEVVSETETSEEIVTPTGQTVDSPIVGVIYLSGAPGDPAYKAVGDTVAIGDTLCIVEAMKIMNEITSEVAGTVTEVLIKNEDVVEYGQPLFRIV